MSTLARAPLPRAFSPAARRRSLVVGAGLALALFAYRALLFGALRPPTSPEFEQWFFMPEQRSPLLPLAVALWILSRRRRKLRTLPERSAPGIAALLFAVGIGSFAWACLAGESSLLMPSLAANLVGFVAARKGRAGCRVALLPALLLLLGTPIPAPLRDPIVWWLQVSSAHGATWLLQAAGIDVVRSGVQLHHGAYAFTVIETCSGLRGIEILLLIALAIRELFADAGWRSWVVVAVAPPLGFALNLLRIAVVVGLTEKIVAPEVAPEGLEHTPQGLAVLLGGTALLYALGRSLSATERTGAAADGERAPAVIDAAPESRSGAALLALGALLSLLSVALPVVPRSALPLPIALPLEHAGWRGEDVELDRVFVGQFAPGQVLNRRYRSDAEAGAPRIVDVLVGYEAVENPSSRLLSPKLLVPAHDWSLGEQRPTRLWLLGIDARMAVASRESEWVLTYLWRLRDEGIWSETLRALLALEVGPLRREQRRVVVRLTTPLAVDGPIARDRARRTLDRFIGDFRLELEGL